MPNEMGIWEQRIDSLTRAGLRVGCASGLLLLCASLATADFSGPVVSVLDGDTIEVLHNQHLKTYISNASELTH